MQEFFVGSLAHSPSVPAILGGSALTTEGDFREHCAPCVARADPIHPRIGERVTLGVLRLPHHDDEAVFDAYCVRFEGDVGVDTTACSEACVFLGVGLKATRREVRLRGLDTARSTALERHVD